MAENGRINQDRLITAFLDLLAIDSPSRQEAAVAKELERRLQALGLETAIDNVGNVIGWLAGAGEPLMLNAHLDHVAPCRGIRPVVEDGIIRSDGSTILGGDDTSGVAIILELLEVLAERRAAGHETPALEIVFTIEEEVGLNGSKGLDIERLRSRVAIVMDMGGPIGGITVQGPSQIKLHAVVKGRRAHAGCAPEEGINAIRVAAEAIAAMPLGRIDMETTSNIGVIQGGEVTNVVPDRVELWGEARSLDQAKLDQQTEAMVDALQEAAGRHGAEVDISVAVSYRAFIIDGEAPLVRRLVEATQAHGLTAELVSTTGGSDSNIFNERGIQAVNYSTGMAKVHTTEECIAISDMVASAEVLARMLER